MSGVCCHWHDHVGMTYLGALLLLAIGLDVLRAYAEPLPAIAKAVLGVGTCWVIVGPWLVESAELYFGTTGLLIAGIYRRGVCAIAAKRRAWRTQGAPTAIVRRSRVDKS